MSISVREDANSTTRGSRCGDFDEALARFDWLASQPPSHRGQQPHVKVSSARAYSEKFNLLLPRLDPLRRQDRGVLPPRSLPTISRILQRCRYNVFHFSENMADLNDLVHSIYVAVPSSKCRGPSNLVFQASKYTV